MKIIKVSKCGECPVCIERKEDGYYCPRETGLQDENGKEYLKLVQVDPNSIDPDCQLEEEK